MGSGILKALSILAIRIGIASIAVSIALPEMAFSAKDIVEYWAETGLSDAHLKKLLSQKRCYSNENSFLGCIAAINSILNAGYPEHILTNKSIENMNVIGDTVRNIQRLKIQKIKNPISLNDKKAMDQSWVSVYKLTLTNPIFFEEILDKALNLTTQKARSMKIAIAINQYYKNALDPHTYIIAVKARQEELTTSESSIVGVGINVQKIDNKIIIVPKTGSPALEAGIRPNDTLLQVDHQNINNASVDDVVNMIRGDENTHVSLSVYRRGQSLSFDIIRAKFVERNLEVQIMNDPIDRSKIGYIKIATFNDISICQKFLRSAITLHDKNVRSLVLDLRGNGGGLVSQAKCIASSYIENGNIIFTEHDPLTNRIKETHKVEKYGASIYNLYGKKPLVILIDSGSASASEMIAGALRAHNRAILVGERSFGKGTVQSQLKWKEDGLDTSELNGVEIMKTTARFHFVNGESNQQIGLIPDIEAYSTLPPSKAVRETDLYPNAISSSMPSKPYTPSAKVLSVKACIAQRNMLSSSYADRINSHLVPNYPISVAREAASCL